MGNVAVEKHKVWHEAPGLRPEAEALAHSQRLIDYINVDMAVSGGWIDFSRFMELALYAPGLGYYSAGSVKLGRSGDFVTAPEMTPVFARTLANPVARVLRQREPEQTQILELGAGTGQLAHDLLLALSEQEVLPDRYLILEVSPDLRQRQQQTLEQLPARLYSRVQWCDHWPEAVTGVVLANEVLDALPVHRLRRSAGQWFLWGVSQGADGWQWELRPLSDVGLLEGLPDMPDFPDPYDTEVAPLVDGLMATLADSLKAGQAIFIDYGFPAREYYHPQRSGGTLMCHYRHHAHADPFLFPGLQDITAHVDFTRVARSARRHGLRVEQWATQAQWLIDEGILQEVEALHGADIIDYGALGAVQKLLSPAEMGELFKVLVLGTGMHHTQTQSNIALAI